MQPARHHLTNCQNPTLATGLRGLATILAALRCGAKRGVAARDCQSSYRRQTTAVARQVTVAHSGLHYSRILGLRPFHSLPGPRTVGICQRSTHLNNRAEPRAALQQGAARDLPGPFRDWGGPGELN